MTKRIAMVFMTGTDDGWAVPEAETLEAALESVSAMLRDEGVLDLFKPEHEQLTARWGYLFDLPGKEGTGEN